MKLDYKDNDFVSIGDNGVTLQYYKRWWNNGMCFGEGLISPDKQYFYLNIPKNASSSIKKILVPLDWEFGNIYDYPTAQVIIILRDPIDRWVTGITEFLLMYHQDTVCKIVEPNIYDWYPLLGESLGMSLLFDTMTFDDHTERQAMFLQNIEFSRCIWLKLDSNLNANFEKLLNEIGYATDTEGVSENSSDAANRVGRQTLKHFFKYVLLRDIAKAYNLKQWFWCDYELMEQVKFYE